MEVTGVLSYRVMGYLGGHVYELLIAVKTGEGSEILAPCKLTS